MVDIFSVVLLLLFFFCGGGGGGIGVGGGRGREVVQSCIKRFDVNITITRTLLFLLEKCEKILIVKDSHIFSTKNNSAFDNVVGISLMS